jgi:hypothetical protein
LESRTHASEEEFEAFEVEELESLELDDATEVSESESSSDTAPPGNIDKRESVSSTITLNVKIKVLIDKEINRFRYYMIQQSKMYLDNENGDVYSGLLVSLPVLNFLTYLKYAASPVVCSPMTTTSPASIAALEYKNHIFKFYYNHVISSFLHVFKKSIDKDPSYVMNIPYSLG